MAASKPNNTEEENIKKEFTISSALVAHQSPALRKLVEGDFREARDGCVTLDWVDEDTFTRFIQYAYTGDYDTADDDPMIPAVARWERRLAKVQEVPEKYRPEWHEWYKTQEFSYKTTNRENKKRGKHCLWDRFSQGANRFNQAKFTLTTNPKADHSRIFLGHAKMYVFADYYGISDLMELSHNKLGQVLLPFKLRDERVADFVAVMRYCYEEPAPEALQEFVIMYAACKAKVLWKDTGFQGLVEETQELSFAFIKQMMGAKVEAMDMVQ
ncbi:hypothetical protein B0I37DRAFT_356466 [Chaetomium sp. MPI-CAGE-AT-0009]|nr:hypothetical protein B0I37DRAFT_356466 [Chaetomium sp. MPI-CAGE-AT-0009]